MSRQKGLRADKVLTTPAYSFAEAAYYLGMPVSTLRSWCLGQSYKDDRAAFPPVIRLDGEPSEGLSFLNLVEAHVLSAIRRVHEIPFHKVRDTLVYVCKKMGSTRPLADVDFQTNGVDLFVEELGLLNVSRGGQVEIGEMLRAHLKRIDRNADGVPIRLYPFTRKHVAQDAPAPIEINPHVSFGRPVLAGRAVPTAVLADRFKAGDTLKELADDYETSSEEIEEAIRCEFDRRAAA
jgi:uncharacterized protein (DUF433 family)